MKSGYNIPKACYLGICTYNHQKNCEQKLLPLGIEYFASLLFIVSPCVLFFFFNYVHVFITLVFKTNFKSKYFTLKSFHFNI